MTLNEAIRLSNAIHEQQPHLWAMPMRVLDDYWQVQVFDVGRGYHDPDQWHAYYRDTVPPAQERQVTA